MWICSGTCGNRRMSECRAKLAYVMLSEKEEDIFCNEGYLILPFDGLI